MTHSNVRIQAHLRSVRDLLGSIPAAGIRTDYVVTSGGSSRRVLHLDRHGVRTAYAFVSPRRYQRATGIRSLRNSVGLPEERADALLDAVESLSSINDMGAWSLSGPGRLAPVVLSAAGVDGDNFMYNGALRPAFNTLQGSVPQVDRVDLLSSTADVPRGTRRYDWAQFMDRTGGQLASISINALFASINSLGHDQREVQQAADRRLGRWAHQLNADQGFFVEAAVGLVSLCRKNRVTRIDLGLL